MLKKEEEVALCIIVYVKLHIKVFSIGIYAFFYPSHANYSSQDIKCALITQTTSSPTTKKGNKSMNIFTPANASFKS